MKILYSILLLIFASSITFSQTNELLIKTAANGYKLRWQPLSVNDWIDGMQDGYIIERKEEGGEYVQLNIKPLKPSCLNGQNMINPTDSALVHFWRSPDTIALYLNDIKKIKEIKRFYMFYVSQILITEGAIQRSGNYYYDQTSVAGMDYEYRVSLSNNKYSVTSNTNNIISRDYIIDPKVEIQNTKLDISWTSNNHDFIKMYKSDNPKMDNFSLSLNTPYYNKETKINEYLYSDTLKTINSTVYYQINTPDFFGDLILGDVIKVTGIDVTAPESAIVNEIHTSSNKIKISWLKETMELDFKGFNIYRSIFADTLFQKVNKELLEPNVNEYNDIYEGDATWIYYYIEVVDLAGNTSISRIKLCVLKGEGALEIPKNLTAEINKKGIVNIIWDNNKEKDLLGYRLSGARDSIAKFISVEQNFLKTNSYIDTLALNFFNKNYYYRIAAIDSNFNSSAYSSAVMIKLPDTICPKQPILNKINIEGARIQLDWKLGTDTDIKNIDVLYKSKTSLDWEIVASLKNPSINTYKHESEFGVFEFAIRTTDKSGNVSIKSNSRFIEIKPAQLLPSISNLEYKKEGEGAIIIFWEVPEMDQKFIYHVMRKTNDSKKSILINTVSASVVKDTKLKIGDTYTYYILPKDEKGKFYRRSENLEVKL